MTAARGKLLLVALPLAVRGSELSVSYPLQKCAAHNVDNINGSVDLYSTDPACTPPPKCKLDTLVGCSCVVLAPNIGEYSAATLDTATLHEHNCLVLAPNETIFTGDALVNDTNPVQHAINSIVGWENSQAVVNVIVASVSFVLGLAYVMCFALFPSLRRYPLSLALHIYVFQLLVSLQFIIVGASRLEYQDFHAERKTESYPWLVSSSPDCLCDWNATYPDGAPRHPREYPGCVCANGYLSFVLQVGGVGSVAFFCAMVHNEYRSVRDPFTKPKSRMRMYQIVCYLMTFVLSVPYLLPNKVAKFMGKSWVGYGYRYEYIMCWSPSREGNAEVQWTTTVPVLFVLVFAPLLHIMSRWLLQTGGFDKLSEQRVVQLHRANLIVGVFAVYWFITGMCYVVANAPQFFMTDTCGGWADFQLKVAWGTPVVEQGDWCHVTGWVQCCFSWLLCAGGGINALVGFIANRDVLGAEWAELRAKGRPRLLCLFRPRVDTEAGYGTLSPLPVGNDMPALSVNDGTESTYSARRGLGDLEQRCVKKGDDLSKALRLDVIRHVMVGIRSRESVDGGVSQLSSNPVNASCSLSSSRSTPFGSMSSAGHGSYPPANGCAAAGPSAPLCFSSATGGGAGSSAPLCASNMFSDGGSSDAAPFASVALASDRGSDHARLPPSIGHHPSAATRQPSANIAALGDAADGAPTALSEMVADPGPATLRDWSRCVKEVQDFGTMAGSPRRGGAAAAASAGGRRSASFRVYAPSAWQWLRESVYGVGSDEFIASMTQGGDLDDEIKHHFSEAKGGGFFFFSVDRRYMVKTMDRDELATLLQILPAYCEHMRTQPRTMLTRISGCYAVTLYGQTKHFMLIDNLFDPSLFAEGKPNEKYDLKGSWVDRHSSPAESTRKDSDWTVTRKLRVSADNRRRLLRQAQNDARFLCGCKLMDYSLLLGIQFVEEARLFVSPTFDDDRTERAAQLAHEIKRLQSELASLSAGGPVMPTIPQTRRSSGSFSVSAMLQSVQRRSEGPLSYSSEQIQGPGEYRLGVIDLLQRWNWRKRAERFLKIVFKWRCSSELRNGMSAVEPVEYARRFHLMVGMKVLGMSKAEVQEDWEEGARERARERALGRREGRDHGNSLGSGRKEEAVHAVASSVQAT